MAPILSDSGLFHVGLPKWAEELALTDPYIARLKEESYMEGVGYILEFFNELIAGGACQDSLLIGMKEQQDAEFDAMIYGDDEALLARAMEEYMAHYRDGIVPAPEAALRTAPDVFKVQRSVTWRPNPEDIVIALEAQAADDLHSDILSDDSMRTDDFGQESAHVDSEMDAISELLAWTGKAEMKQRAPLANILATIEARWDSYTDKQRKFIDKLIGETTITERIEKRRNAKGVMINCPVSVRRISTLFEMAHGATMEMLVENAVDAFEQQEAVNDTTAHPAGETEPQVQIALDNQTRMLDWCAKAAKPNEQKNTKGKPWLAHPSYQAVLGYAMSNGARTPKVAHNRAYAADTLRLPDRILGYDSKDGFLVMLNKSQSQTGLVPVADARVVYPHLPASAKARMKQLSQTEAVAPMAQ